MNKDIDVSSLKIDLYSDKSVRDFTADVAQKDGRMWLSNVSPRSRRKRRRLR